MSAFDLALKTLHLRTKSNGDVLAYVAFPFNDESATQNEIAANNQRFSRMGFGSRYVCFYPARFSKHGETILLSPWLEMTEDEWVSIDISDCIFAVQVEPKFEAQYHEFLKNRAIDIEQTVVKYMSFHNVVPQDDETPTKIVVTDYRRPLLPGKDYVLDYSIPPNRTIH